MLGRSPIVVERVPAITLDPRMELLLEARAALKLALQARDRAREAHLAAQRAVDQVSAVVRHLEEAQP